MCSKPCSGSSIYKGVSKVKQQHPTRWRARIKLDGKHRHLGYHSSEVEAALAYNEKAIELFGAFAKLNVIDLDAM